MATTKTIDASKYAYALAIGRQMENNYRQIIFNCAGFGVEVASIMLVHQRSQDTAPYIVAETTGEDSLTWTITNTDTAYAGAGKAELRVSFTNGLAKSVVYTTHVIKSITGDTEIPEPLQSWYDAMIEYIDDHAATPEQIEAAVEAYLEDHPIPAPVQSVNSKTGDVVLSASDVGALPDDTVIPTVPTNVSAFTNDAGYISSIPAEYVTDTELQEELTDYATKAEIPEKTSELINDSGFLTAESDPVFSASPAAGITAQDISDWNGKSDFSGSYNDLTNKPTIPAASSATPADLGTAAAGNSTDYSRADHVHKKPTAADIGAYTKPSGGIPKEDLASAVQTSLGKADTALQTAVTSFNGNTGAVTYTAPVTSVNGQTGAVTVTDTDTTYTFSISGNVITITPSGGAVQTITLPVYNGGIS